MMSNEPIIKTNWNDVSEGGEVIYSRLSVAALLSVVFGIGTFLVFFSTWFFFLGVIAILCSLLALWSIRAAEGIITGTFLAYLGLCSAVIALVSIAVFWSAYHCGLRQEADQFFRLWFTAALQGDIPQAKEFHQLYHHRSKAASAEEWWENQYAEKYAHRSVHDYVNNKLLRVLGTLGDDTAVSYYKTESVTTEHESSTVVMIYAVTYQGESGQPETFFVRIGGKRRHPAGNSDHKSAGWLLDGTPSFQLPDEFKKDNRN